MRYFIFILFCIAVSSCGGGEKKTGAKSGADLYRENCLVCHGEDGKAGMAGATDLSTSTLSHEAAVSVVTNGRNGMRSFAAELSAQDIEAVVKHIETLRK